MRGVRRAVGARAPVDVRIAGERRRDVVDVAAAAVAVDHAADRKLVVDERQVEHNIGARVRIAVRGDAVTAFGAALGDVELGLVRDVADRAGLGAAAEQRTLRALEHFDAVHVDHVDIEVAPREGQRLVVEVGRDVRERVDRGRGLAACEADGEAAHVDVALTRAVRTEGHVRQQLDDVVECRHAQLAELVARDRLDRDRHVLNRFRTPLRRDDDLLESGGRRCFRRRPGRPRGAAEDRRDCARKLLIDIQASLPKESVAIKIRKRNERNRYARRIGTADNIPDRSSLHSSQLRPANSRCVAFYAQQITYL